MTEKADPQRKTKDQSRRLDPERGRLKDSFGSWKMSGEEEEGIFSSLKENWKRTTLVIRSPARDAFAKSKP